MSAYVLEKAHIDILTQATAAVLQMNRKYSASYPLDEKTVEIFGKYADDLHSVYRALYIANIKAVNGRYGESNKELPRYTELRPWNVDRINVLDWKKAISIFACYSYQIAEDPIIYSPVWYAIQDVFKLMCMIYATHRTV